LKPAGKRDLPLRRQQAGVDKYKGSTPMRIGIVLIMGALSGLTPAAGKTFSSAELDQWFQGLGTRERACGPLALWYCLCQLGYAMPQQDSFLHQHLPGEQGTNLEALQEVARAWGVPLQVWQMETADLAHLPIPAILITKDQHCLVYEGRTAEDKIRLLEPSQGTIQDLSVGTVQEVWSGLVLVFKEPALGRAAFLRWLVLSLLATLGLGILLWLGKSYWQCRRQTPPPLEHSPP
jgi:hypothetical protein